NFPDRIRHPLIGNRQKAFEQFPIIRNFPPALFDLLPQLRKTLLRLLRKNGNRKSADIDPPEQKMNIGQRKRSATAITGRPRRSSRALRPDTKLSSIKRTDRPASRSDRFDLERRNKKMRITDRLLKRI